jgi:hypothetical protein
MDWSIFAGAGMQTRLALVQPAMCQFKCRFRWCIRRCVDAKAASVGIRQLRRKSLLGTPRPAAKATIQRGNP